MIEKLIGYFEKQAFGVCAWWGDRLGLPTVYIRLFFIYSSFFTLGVSFIVYMNMAFFLRIFRFIFERRRSVWEMN
jgi:phage shock protein C